MSTTKAGAEDLMPRWMTPRMGKLAGIGRHDYDRYVAVVKLRSRIGEDDTYPMIWRQEADSDATD